MYSKEKILEILEAYDLTKSFRAAAALTGCDHHTVARYVAARAAGLDPSIGGGRPSVSEPFVDKILEWVDRSDGRIRADVVHEKLDALGYPGSERTTRRVVAVVKEQWRRASHRVYMPWITEPGLWLQWDYAAGPMLGGQRIVLFVAWLAWSRLRVVVPLRDRTMPSVIAALDATFRRIGGAPTFALTDNEKTVTDRHIAGIAVRNPQIVAVAHYYGLTIANGAREGRQAVLRLRFGEFAVVRPRGGGDGGADGGAAYARRGVQAAGGGQADLFYGVPTLYAAMLADPDFPEEAAWRCALHFSGRSAAAADLRGLQGDIGVDILDGIGSTEMLHIFLSNRPGDFRYGTTGKAVPGYELRLVDEQGEPVKQGELGELEISGTSSAMMLLEQPRQEPRHLPGAWTKSGDKYLRTRTGSTSTAGARTTC